MHVSRRDTPQCKNASLLMLMLSLVALAPISACNLQRKGGPGARPNLAARAAAPWPFAPDEIRIHPLTRFVEHPVTGEISIEVHLELLDPFGDEVKGVGQLLLELYREMGPVSGVGEARQLERWSLDLVDLEENARAYDRVTRTYRLTLTGLPPEARAGETLELRAQLTMPEGRRLLASHRMGL